jgi:peptide/nickel transport system ATP-binding protein
VVAETGTGEGAGIVPESGQAAPLLVVQDLRTYIQRHRGGDIRAVDGVSLSVGAGETVGLVGESGCGKTMTGRSIMRLLPPGGHVVGGSIRLAGRELTTLSEAEMRQVRGNEVAMIFQDPASYLNPTKTIGAQVAEPVRAHLGASKRAALDRATEVLTLVGLPRPKERLGDYPHQLSGGLRQRVMIAMALACEPKLLIADEPTTALDVTIQAQILALLDELRARLTMGVLLITHDMGVIAGRADRVIVMYAGRVVEEAGAVSLFGQMRHPYTRALLDSIPHLYDPKVRWLRSIPGMPPDLSHPPSWCRFEPRCPAATSRCRREDPRLEPVHDDATHRFACFHPVGLPGAPAPTEPCPVVVAEGAAARPEPASPDLLIEVDGVVKEFGVMAGTVLRRRIGSVKAVSGVSFGVVRGETFALVGESGCGKTTLGRMIAALERPDAGSIRIDGTDLFSLHGRELRRRRRDVQLMFQDSLSVLDPRMRVGAALREPMAIQHVGSRAEREIRVAELLSDVGIDPSAVGLYPHEFSGGQRQRLGLARALVLGPRLIVADEPVSALDVSIRSQVLNLMKRVQRTSDLTYVVISHDLSVVRYLADRIGVMYLGKLVEVGPADDIYLRPAHPYTAGLLEAVPVPDPERERAKPPVPVVGELPSPISPPSGCRFRTRCPRAAAVCSEEEPQMQPFDGDGHLAACHFPLRPVALALGPVSQSAAAR